MPKAVRDGGPRSSPAVSARHHTSHSTGVLHRDRRNAFALHDVNFAPGHLEEVGKSDGRANIWGVLLLPTVVGLSWQMHPYLFTCSTDRGPTHADVCPRSALGYSHGACWPCLQRSGLSISKLCRESNTLQKKQQGRSAISSVFSGRLCTRRPMVRRLSWHSTCSIPPAACLSTPGPRLHRDGRRHPIIVHTGHGSDASWRLGSGGPPLWSSSPASRVCNAALGTKCTLGRGVRSLPFSGLPPGGRPPWLPTARHLKLLSMCRRPTQFASADAHQS